MPACPRGLFGQDCTDKCRDTCMGCNHINGLCDYGCRPDWKGDYCHIGNVNYFNTNICFPCLNFLSKF